VEEIIERQRLVGRVRQALHVLLGEDYVVEDCSMHDYAGELHDAPLDLIIVVSLQWDSRKHPPS
jgi:hypothetical protein